MIIDASALIAILRDEPEAPACAVAIENAGQRRAFIHPSRTLARCEVAAFARTRVSVARSFTLPALWRDAAT